MRRMAVVIVASGLLVAGCGSNPGDRAITGGVMGAGVGALAGATTMEPGTKPKA